MAEALSYFEQAAKNAPSRGIDKATIYRDWGYCLKDSGDPEAAKLAYEKLEVAALELPNDLSLIIDLGELFDRKGIYNKVIKYMEPIMGHKSVEHKRRAAPLLLRAYERTGNMIKTAELKILLSKI
jgi:tetratricopeptide (TPR) repeat protein